MSNLEFVVIDVKNGTEAQKNAGIMANFNLNVIVDGVTILTLRDLKVMKSKKSSGVFIAFPSNSYVRKDGTKAYNNYIDFFPGSEDKTAQKAILDQVRRITESLGSTPKAPVPSKPAPTTSPREGW